MESFALLMSLCDSDVKNQESSHCTRNEPRLHRPEYTIKKHLNTGSTSDLKVRHNKAMESYKSNEFVPS